MNFLTPPLPKRQLDTKKTVLVPCRVNETRTRNIRVHNTKHAFFRVCSLKYLKDVLHLFTYLNEK
jgi:hypothetical protein